VDGLKDAVKDLKTELKQRSKLSEDVFPSEQVRAIIKVEVGEALMNDRERLNEKFERLDKELEQFHLDTQGGDKLVWQQLESLRSGLNRMQELQSLEGKEVQEINGIQKKFEMLDRELDQFHQDTQQGDELVREQFNCLRTDLDKIQDSFISLENRVDKNLKDIYDRLGLNLDKFKGISSDDNYEDLGMFEMRNRSEKKGKVK